MFFCSVSFSLLEHLEALACNVNVLLCARQIPGSYVKKKMRALLNIKYQIYPLKFFINFFFPLKDFLKTKTSYRGCLEHLFFRSKNIIFEPFGNRRVTVDFLG